MTKIAPWHLISNDRYKPEAMTDMPYGGTATISRKERIALLIEELAASVNSGDANAHNVQSSILKSLAQVIREPEDN